MLHEHTEHKGTWNYWHSNCDLWVAILCSHVVGADNLKDCTASFAYNIADITIYRRPCHTLYHKAHWAVRLTGDRMAHKVHKVHQTLRHTGKWVEDSDIKYMYTGHWDTQRTSQHLVPWTASDIEMYTKLASTLCHKLYWTLRLTTDQVALFHGEVYETLQRYNHSIPSLLNINLENLPRLKNSRHICWYKHNHQQHAQMLSCFSFDSECVTLYCFSQHQINQLLKLKHYLYETLVIL